MNRRLLLGAVSALSVMAGQAWALQAPAPDAAETQTAQSEELVVTATRSPMQLDKIGSSVTVLDLKKIESSQAIGATELLVQTPGVTFSRNGGLGRNTSVYIRGAETDQTVFLIDGVKLNDPSSTGGGFNAADLLIGDISRIEVLRGAQSTLWGSQAIGGVIDVITREPTKSLEADVKVEGGSYHSGLIKAGLGGKSDKLTWRAAGGYFTTDGISVIAAGREPDGYRNIGGSARLSYQLTDWAAVDVRAVYSKGRAELDSTAGDDATTADTRELVFYSGLNLEALGGRLKNRFALQYTDVDRINTDPLQANNPLTFDAVGENRRLEYQGTFAIAPGYTAVFGAERERSRSSSASPSAARPNPTPAGGRSGIDGLYAQLQAEPLTGLSLTGGVRHDNHRTFGGHTLGQASVAWKLFDGATILRASYGGGFKAPSLFQTYSEFGNGRLNPEKANSYDGGVEQRFLNGRVVVRATYFHRATDNLIVFVSCAAGTKDPLCTGPTGLSRFGYYDNVNKAKAAGWELGGEFRPFDNLVISANYTSLKAQDATPGSATFSRFLARRPKQSANLTVSYLWPFKLSTGFSIRRAGSSFNNAANTQRLKAYTLVDIRASYPINEHIEIYARMENLFEQSYQTILTYGSYGQTSYMGVRLMY